MIIFKERFKVFIWQSPFVCIQWVIKTNEQLLENTH